MAVVVAPESPPPAPEEKKRESAVFDFTPAHIGFRVEVENYGNGEITFVGNHKINGRVRIGVVLDLPNGINDGTVGGHTYFVCEPKHGILADPKLGNRVGTCFVFHLL